LPHKRYVRDAVLQRATDYLEHELRSYRQAARDEWPSIGYLAPAPDAANTRTTDAANTRTTDATNTRTTDAANTRTTDATNTRTTDATNTRTTDATKTRTTDATNAPTTDPECPATALRQHAAAAAIDERHFSHTTIWRWLGWLGRLRQPLRSALELIRQKDPRSTLHRQVCAVPALKYRTPARRTLLEHALRLLRAAALFGRLFHREFFPYFATADSGG